MLLQTKTNKDMSKIEQLSEIIDSISASRDIRELLQASLNQTLKALSSERGSIFMAGEDGEELQEVKLPTEQLPLPRFQEQQALSAGRLLLPLLQEGISPTQLLPPRTSQT